jgi:hypothetical protein
MIKIRSIDFPRGDQYGANSTTSAIKLKLRGIEMGFKLKIEG